MKTHRLGVTTLAMWVLCVVTVGVAQAQDGSPIELAPAELQRAIDNLGDLDYGVRMEAGQALRRAPARQAVAALQDAVEGHPDGYVRFRALVLLAGFDDPRTPGLMRSLLNDPNGRVREVAYGWHEHNPNPNIVPELLQLLEREQDEFLRPALVRALAAHASDPRVRDTLIADVGRGQDFFRSAVIEALGEYRAGAAVSSITDVATIDGPLQDDAVIALGRIGDRRSLETLANLQRSASEENQPAIAAAICLLGVNCASHLQYLSDTLFFTVQNPGFQALARSAASAAAVLAAAGHREALQLLLDAGVASVNPVRAPIALAVGTVALRNPTLLLETLQDYPDHPRTVALLGEGFDMLEEDFEEERFFSVVRRDYWRAAEGSTERDLSEALVQRLDF